MVLDILSTIGSGFNPSSALQTAFFGGVFAIIAIVFKQIYDSNSEKTRYAAVLRAETSDVTEHFDRNISRLETMISALRDTPDLWPERLHIQKLLWPQDTAFFNKDILKYFSVNTANNIMKFRLRLRNANYDVEGALRVYDQENREKLRVVLEYIRNRSFRLKQLAPNALNDRKEVQISPGDVAPDCYAHVKDMVFFRLGAEARHPTDPAMPAPAMSAQVMSASGMSAIDGTEA